MRINARTVLESGTGQKVKKYLYAIGNLLQFLV